LSKTFVDVYDKLLNGELKKTTTIDKIHLLRSNLMCNNQARTKKLIAPEKIID
jgi:hypothetical protein